MTDAFIWQSASQLLIADAAVSRIRDIVHSGDSLSISADGPRAVQTSRPMLFCATSGSSGVPKVVQRTPLSWQHSFTVNAAVLGIRQGDVVAVLGGPAASLSLYAVLEAAHLGADILPLQGVRPDRQAALLSHHAATMLYATPVQLDQLCRGAAPLLHLRHVMVGGGRLPIATAQAIAALCPQARLTQFYGAAETSFIAWSDATTPQGAVGRAYPGVELELDDSGEIWVRSPYLSQGYAQGESPDTRWQDGYLSVGEIGRLDAQGNLFILGRKSRMVTIADTNVFPDQIESWLEQRLNTPAAVVAVADARRGARLVGFVAGPVAASDLDHALRECRARFGPLAAPRRILVRPNLPQLATGKPDYHALSALAAAVA